MFVKIHKMKELAVVLQTVDTNKKSSSSAAAAEEKET